jgi:hypothetical protein
MVTLSFGWDATTGASFQKASSVGLASGSSLSAAGISSSVIERTRRQSVLGSVFEAVPDVSSLMRLRPPGQYDVALIRVAIENPRRIAKSDATPADIRGILGGIPRQPRPASLRDVFTAVEM